MRGELQLLYSANADKNLYDKCLPAMMKAVFYDSFFDVVAARALHLVND